MARQTGVEFIKEGFRFADQAREAEPAVREDSIARTKAYNTYVTPTLQLLAQEPARSLSERNLFEAVAGRVKEPDFHEFRLALQAFDAARLIEQSGRDAVFGDPQYRITSNGLSVTPPA